jgi:hypothetical protein
VSGDPERHDGPTEIVETESGELIERLSGSTATLLLAWLIGIGALSTLLAVWIFVWAISGERLGFNSLFSGFGFYTALGGAAGPCVLWLAGRAQGRSLRWFLVTALKIGLVMLGIVVGVVLLATLIMAGAVPGPGAIAAAGVLLLLTLLLSTIWAVATWSADRWIARARVG